MIGKAQKVLKEQLKRSKLIVVAALVVVGVMSYFIFSTPPSDSPTFKMNVDLPVDKINPQEIWMNRIETALKVSDQKTKYLEDIVLSSKKQEGEDEHEKVKLRQEISELKKELRIVAENATPRRDNHAVSASNEYPRTTSHSSNHATPSAFSSSSFSGRDPFVSANSSHLQPDLNNDLPYEEEFVKPPLKEYSMDHIEKRSIPVEDVVPANVSVRALLVSSVDAVCGVYSNTDPVPVKLRLLDDAHLPSGVKIKLKGCLVGASAYGNLSSERVYMRLESLTQVYPNGEAIESEVTGYVSGEDGKYGVRGIVIDRSTKIVKNAALSGFVSGVGQVLQSAVSRQPIDCGNTYAVGTEAAGRGAMTGVSNSFDMLADYYIRRAEQVQPVLQVNAGRFVDITFTHGFARGDLDTKNKVKNIRQRSRNN